MKTLFLVSLATARRIGELQAISHRVSKAGKDLVLTYIPRFVAKTESDRNPLKCFFPRRALDDFVGNMREETVLCPVRAVRYYIRATAGVDPRPDTLFVSPKNPSRPLSKNALSALLRKVIATAMGTDASHKPHSIRSVATSACFLRNWSVTKVLEAATWKSNSVFASFYLKDVAFTLDNCQSLGPFVAAGDLVRPSSANW